MPADYLEDLGDRYDRWFEGYDQGRKMRVIAEEHDFLHSEDDLSALVERIGASLPQPMLPFADA
jgi:deoxyadenosine/deoxycytidine kinase